MVYVREHFAYLPFQECYGAMSSSLFKKKLYLHIWLCWVFAVKCRIFTAPCKTSHCDTQIIQPQTEGSVAQRRAYLLLGMQGLEASRGSDGKESACNAGDPGLIPGLERSPGEGNSNPHQYSCLENPVDRGAGGATVHGISKSPTRLSG